jgi:hypothetical protein
VANELLRGKLAPESGKTKLLATRERVVADWKRTAGVLRAQGQESLAREVEDYVRRMPAVATEKELIAKELLTRIAAQRARDRAPEREPPVTQRAR